VHKNFCPVCVKLDTKTGRGDNLLRLTIRETIWEKRLKCSDSNKCPAIWWSVAWCGTVIRLLQSGAEDRGDVQAVFRAAVVTTSLRLWHESRQVSADGCREPQTQVPQTGRVCPAAQGHYGRQHAQVPCTGYGLRAIDNHQFNVTTETTCLRLSWLEWCSSIIPSSPNKTTLQPRSSSIAIFIFMVLCRLVKIIVIITAQLLYIIYYSM